MLVARGRSSDAVLADDLPAPGGLPAAQETAAHVRSATPAGVRAPDATPPAVVVGLASLVGLQTARVLAGHDVPVVGVLTNRDHFAARTRVCRRIVEADVYSESLVDRLAEIGAELGARAVLVPCTDRSTLLISAARAELSRWFDISLPEHESLVQLADKALFHDLARRLGLSVPVTRAVGNPVEARAAGADLRFPVVLKPARKSSTWDRLAGGKVVFADGPDDLVDVAERTGRPFLAQEFVPGDDTALFTVNGYYVHGRPLATFTTQKVRQWPPRVGTASYAREQRNDEVVEIVNRVFAAVSFSGLGYIEVKRDDRCGGYALIEANVGRPTGRSTTAEAGGVELTMTMHRHAAGLPLPEPEQRTQRYRGAAWVDLRRDVLAGARAVRERRATVPGLLADWTRPHTAHAAASLTDPLPFVCDVTQSLGRWARRTVGGLAGLPGAARLWGRHDARSRSRPPG